MKNAVLLLMALLLLPSFAMANPLAQRAAERAAATLTNRVMGMLEPQIAELAKQAPIPPEAKGELRHQLTQAARRIVEQEVQSAMGGQLPNANELVQKVGVELVEIAQNVAQGILDGTIEITISPEAFAAQMSATSETGADGNRERRPWKSRYTYVGGSLGFGTHEKRVYHSWGDEDEGKEFFNVAFVADFPVLAPVISLETGLMLGGPTVGVPLIGRLGFISERFESTFDIGYHIGGMGSVVGGTIGFGAGPGMLFIRYQLVDIDDGAHTISVGYKVGVGRSRNRE